MTFEEEMRFWRLILERLSPNQKCALLAAVVKLLANKDGAAIFDYPGANVAFAAKTSE